MASSLQNIEDNLRELLEAFYSEATTVITNQDETSTIDPLTGETIDVDDVVFYYSLTDLQNEIYKLTSMRARFIKSDQGIPQVKELAFSPDEQLLFDSLAKDAANEIFKRLCANTKNLNNAFLYDAEPEVDDHVPGTSYVIGDFVKYDDVIYKCIQATDSVLPDDDDGGDYWESYSWLDSDGKITYIVELPQYFNPNYLNTMDNNIWTALKKYILKEWYRNTGLIQDYQIESAEYDRAITSVGTSFLHRTVHLSRNPRWL